MITKRMSKRKKIVIISAAAIGSIALVLILLEISNVTNFVSSESQNEVVTQNNGSNADAGKGESSATTSRNDVPGPSSSDNTKTQTNSANTTDSGEAPRTPTGTFVSNHFADMSSQESSNCTTSPGATCEIVFTKDGNSISLSSQTTDSNGYTFWSWAPSQVGLSPGTWTVQAKATQNGKTVTANDALNLEIS